MFWLNHETHICYWCRSLIWFSSDIFYNAKLIDIYRTRHNVSASTGLSDPAVATGISDLIYESSKTPAAAEPDALDDDLVNAWAANLGDDGLWGNNAPAMNRDKASRGSGPSIYEVIGSPIREEPPPYSSPRRHRNESFENPLASPLNPTLDGSLTRLQRCAFSGSREKIRQFSTRPHHRRRRKNGYEHKPPDRPDLIVFAIHGCLFSLIYFIIQQREANREARKLDKRKEEGRRFAEANYAEGTKWPLPEEVD